MLFASARRRWLFVALSGMDMSVLTALWLLVSFWLGWSWSPWAVWGGLWGGFLLWTFFIEGLAHWRVSLTVYRLAVVAMVLVSSLALVRLLFYHGLPWSQWAWVRETLFVAPFDWSPRPRLELVLMFTNLSVALRAAALSDRNLYDRFVLESFLRAWLGFMVCAVGLEAMGGPSLWGMLGALLLSGSAAVLMARVETRTANVHTAGHSLAPRHWLALLGTQGIGVSLGWLVGPWLEGALWQGLALLAALMGALFALLIAAFLALVQWLLPGMLALLQGEGTAPPEVTPPAPPPFVVTPVPGATPPPPLPESALRTLEGVLRGGWLVLLVAFLFIVMSLTLQRVRRGRDRAIADEEGQRERVSMQAALARLARGMRDALEAVRHFGLGRALLDAVSVQNMYANVCRLAAARHVPRAPQQAPDRYLAQLVALYPEVEVELTRLTALYMRVHYGERPPSAEELAQARADYVRIVEADEAKG